MDAGDHHVAFVELEEILVDEASSGNNAVVVDGTPSGTLEDETANEAMSTGYLREIGAVTAAGRAVVPEASAQ
jgi:hypothetical protein